MSEQATNPIDAPTSPEPPRQRRVMVAMSHPDDAEFGCAGTVARWAAEGAHVTFVLGTSGDKGSADAEMTGGRLSNTREDEQRAACEVLGVQEVVFLRMPDAELVPDLAMRKVLTRVIRQHKPDVVFCQDPTSRWEGNFYLQHPDHIAMGEAVLAAIYPSARDRLTFPDLLAEGLEPHNVAEVYIGSSLEKCDTFVDISDYLQHKFDALAAHTSQMGEWDFRPMLSRWAADNASEARRRGMRGFDDTTHAEAFKRIIIEG